jgi:nicotinamidase-related amidase
LSNISYDYRLDDGGPHGIAVSSWLEKEKLALLIIDVQNYITKEKYGGVWTSGDKKAYYYHRCNTTVVPNLRRMIQHFRKNSVRVVYTRIASLDKNLSDVPGISRKVLARELFDADGNMYHLHVDEQASMIDERIGPRGEDIVITKTVSGAFCSSTIDLVLRNNGISRLIIGGGLTDACVSSSAREAYDRGYLCTVVEDACITSSEENHHAALRSLRKFYAWVTTTKNLLQKTESVWR